MRRSLLCVGLLFTFAGCAPNSMVSPSEMGGLTARYAVPARSPAAGAPKADLAAPEVTPTETQLIQRQVIYSGAIRLVVVSVADSIASITAIGKESGGYLQQSDAGSISIRVPADKFEAAMDRIAKLGEVVDRSVKASDVTEEMLDLNLRLDTARQARDRLLDHLKKSEKLEDTLKIEAELRRVTTEIEQMEGKQRFMQSQIAMSTIRVDLNANSPQSMNGGDRLGVPFAWISRLGDGLIAGSVEANGRQPQLFNGGPSFTPPDGFIRYYASDSLVEAMNADGLRIKVQRQDNYDRGNLQFWKTLARRSLVETRSLAIAEERDLDADSALLRGTRDVGGKPFGYVLMLTRTKDHVLTFEAWGPAATMEGLRGAIEASARTLKR